MHKSLAIVGAGGHGRVVADTAALTDRWGSIVFYDDQKPAGSKVYGWEVKGPTNQLLLDASQYTDFFVAIGDNAARLEVAERLRAQGLPLCSIVHPCACISPNATVDDSCLISAGAIINIGTTIGFASVINTRASVDHDCTIGSAVHIAPGAVLGGGVVVGDSSWIGIGASVRHEIEIGSGVMVGAGAAVVSNIGNGLTVKGVPAK